MLVRAIGFVLCVERAMARRVQSAKNVQGEVDVAIPRLPNSPKQGIGCVVNVMSCSLRGTCGVGLVVESLLQSPN